MVIYNISYTYVVIAVGIELTLNDVQSWKFNLPYILMCSVLF